MDYEPWQLQRIRQGVRAFQHMAGYTWPEIEAEIKVETGAVVPHGRLSKFVIGEPHRSKKAFGVRHYPPPTSDRLEAVVKFLTNPESTGFVFSREDLNLYAPQTQGPLRLMEYLNGGGDAPDGATRFISPKALSGAFASEYSKEDGKLAVSVRFSKASYESLLQFALIEYNDDTLRLPEVFEEEIEQLAKEKIVINRYMGFAVLTPEENLMLFGKRVTNGENICYLSLGIDSAIYREVSEINALVLLKHDFPVDYVDLNVESDQIRLLDAVKEELSSRISLFTRITEEYPDNETNNGEEG